jgi:heme-degrading monooxygenase HmoA
MLAAKEVVQVFARVSTIQGAPEAAEQGIRTIREQVLPAAKGMQGFRGMLALIDRSTGKSVGVTLWASEDEMRASEEAANRLRASSAQTGGGQIVSVERYEVALDVRES